MVLEGGKLGLEKLGKVRLNNFKEGSGQINWVYWWGFSRKGRPINGIYSNFF